MNFRITPRKVRFSIVSVSATLTDFAALITLTSFGVPIILANYISTSLGFIVSFFGSKKYAFKTANHRIKHEIPLFLLITLTGIWLLQPFIIWAIKPFIMELPIMNWGVVVLAKLAASSVTFLWNYLFYTRLVFKKKK